MKSKTTFLKEIRGFVCKVVPCEASRHDNMKQYSKPQFWELRRIYFADYVTIFLTNYFRREMFADRPGLGLGFLASE